MIVFGLSWTSLRGRVLAVEMVFISASNELAPESAPQRRAGVAGGKRRRRPDDRPRRRPAVFPELARIDRLGT